MALSVAQGFETAILDLHYELLSSMMVFVGLSATALEMQPMQLQQEKPSKELVRAPLLARALSAWSPSKK
jgi:hypothetical protein